MNINFNYKIEKSPENFLNKGNKTSLIEYERDLAFYSSLGSKKAEFSFGDSTMITDGDVEFCKGGPFGNYLQLSDKVNFKSSNFISVGSKGRISFYIAPMKITGYHEIALVKNDSFPENGLPAGDYSLTIQAENEQAVSLNFTFTEETSFSTLKNRFLFTLDSKYPVSVDNNYTASGTIAIKSRYQDKQIIIDDGNQGTSLLDYLDVKTITYGAIPTSSVELFLLGDISITAFPKKVSGVNTSYLNIKIGSLSYETVWEKSLGEFTNIEIDFDSSVAYIFIDGELSSVKIISARETQVVPLYLSGSSDLPYGFDELIINSNIKHRETFELSTVQLTKYSTLNPYIDYYFSSKFLTKGFEIKTLSNSKNLSALICKDDKFYSYSAGAWRKVDGTYESSSDFYTLKNQIKDFEFKGEDFFIRVFFHSDGVTNAYLEGLIFITNDSERLVSGNDVAAVLVSNKLDDSITIATSYLENDEEVFETNRSKLIITTDLGKTEINLLDDENYFSTTKAVKALKVGETSTSSVEYTVYKITPEKLQSLIQENYPLGIESVTLSEDNELILISETKGRDAYISVSGNAYSTFFNENFSQGTSFDLNTIDYTEFFNACRSYGGAPILSWEITDTQMKLYLKEALYFMKKWKNLNTSYYDCQLKGDAKNGYEIPSVIESANDIVDVIFRPVFPISFYGSDMLDTEQDVISLTLANGLLGGSTAGTFGGVSQNLASDYYISLMSIQDFKNVLGINPRWELLNGKLFIFPANIARFTKVGIKYKSPISEQEALRNMDLIKYVTGKCWMQMGVDRSNSTFGSNFSFGDGSANGAGDSLYDRGKVLVDSVLEEWKESATASLGIFFV